MTSFTIVGIAVHFQQNMHYFTNEAHDIIEKAAKDPLLKPWRNQGSPHILTQNANQPAEAIDRFAFMKAIKLKRMFLTVNNRETYLTKREIDCAALLVQGKNNRTISNELFISQRTVETHLESLRIKTNCNDRSELISFLLNNGFRAYQISMNRI